MQRFGKITWLLVGALAYELVSASCHLLHFCIMNNYFAAPNHSLMPIGVPGLADLTYARLDKIAASAAISSCMPNASSAVLFALVLGKFKWNPPKNPKRFTVYQAPNGSLWRWDQPRDPATGQFVADDPATPEQESALDWHPA